ncbi:MAG: hypothetical protein PHV13_02945 [Candidatus ainarchaeum sp.]|nr:hypothetical protein [Candidatus ainarchaeum sp.]
MNPLDIRLPNVYTIRPFPFWSLDQIAQSLMNAIQAGVSKIEQDLGALIWKPLQSTVAAATGAVTGAVVGAQQTINSVEAKVTGAAVGVVTGAGAAVQTAVAGVGRTIKEQEDDMLKMALIGCGIVLLLLFVAVRKE